jgi:phosphoribosylformylglycinamidine synthase subunit PurS
MYNAIVTVTLRSSILDPEGKTIEQSLHQLGYTGIHRVRTGKHIELTVDAPSEEAAREMVENISSRLLANPVMEDYSYTIVKDGEAKE